MRTSSMAHWRFPWGHITLTDHQFDPIKLLVGLLLGCLLIPVNVQAMYEIGTFLYAPNAKSEILGFVVVAIIIEAIVWVLCCGRNNGLELEFRNFSTDSNAQRTLEFSLTWLWTPASFGYSFSLLWVLVPYLDRLPTWAIVFSPLTTMCIACMVLAIMSVCLNVRDMGREIWSFIHTTRTYVAQKRKEKDNSDETGAKRSS